MNAALKRFFDELRADPNNGVSLAQAHEEMMWAMYLESGEEPDTQKIYDDAVAIRRRCGNAPGQVVHHRRRDSDF
jgi:hypothetical protein